MESWLNSAGASGLGVLELADFPDTGRGIRTLTEFNEGDRILTIPRDALWTVSRAHADPTLGPALLSMQPRLSGDDTLITYLLFARSRTAEYDGPRKHIAAMPKSYTSSIYFTDAELDIAEGSSLYTVTKRLHLQIEEDYEHLKTRLFQPHRNLFPPSSTTIEDYKWALCTIWSRAMDFKLHDGQSLRLLAPFADMLNHSFETRKCHSYDPVSGSLSIHAGKIYGTGDQVYINYGPVPNNRLSRLYGFIMPDNPHDSYDLVLSTHPMAPLYEEKCRLWSASGLDSTMTVALTLSEPLPNEVLRYLRIQRLNDIDLVTVQSQSSGAAADKVNDANEREVLQFLVEALSSLLAGFAIQVEQLEAQLRTGMYKSGSNAFCAAHVSLGEQRILRLSHSISMKLLMATDSYEKGPTASAQCAKCGRVSAKLMQCGRCLRVRYCSRDCQVSDYKVHKPSCRTVAASAVHR